jgi:hypothetical protein
VLRQWGTFSVFAECVWCDIHAGAVKLGGHCATSGKVMGSIPDDVIGIFHSQNSFSSVMALV